LLPQHANVHQVTDLCAEVARTIEDTDITGEAVLQIYKFLVTHQATKLKEILRERVSKYLLGTDTDAEKEDWKYRVSILRQLTAAPITHKFSSGNNADMEIRLPPCTGMVSDAMRDQLAKIMVDIDMERHEAALLITAKRKRGPTPGKKGAKNRGKGCRKELAKNCGKRKRVASNDEETSTSDGLVQVDPLLAIDRSKFRSKREGLWKTATKNFQNERRKQTVVVTPSNDAGIASEGFSLELKKHSEPQCDADVATAVSSIIEDILEHSVAENCEACAGSSMCPTTIECSALLCNITICEVCLLHEGKSPSNNLLYYCRGCRCEVHSWHDGNDRQYNFTVSQCHSYRRGQTHYTRSC
jgi:hypothetical protein